MTTKKQQAEYIVGATLERLKNKQSHEDAIVELKTRWPKTGDSEDEYRFVRQIAAHANAAGGDDIFWLIGVNKEDGAVGALDNELANWRARYEPQFQGGVFPVITHINVQADNGNNVVVLIIETDRAPYVVKNPHFNKELRDRKKPDERISTPIEWEVPWRSLESTRSATRADLLQLLVPRQPLPELEIESLHVNEQLLLDDQQSQLYVIASVYVIPRSERSVAVIRRSSSVELATTFPNDLSIRLAIEHLQADGAAVDGSFSEAIFRGPGLLTLHAKAVVPSQTEIFPAPVDVRVIVGTNLSNKPSVAAATVFPAPDFVRVDRMIAKWIRRS